MRREPLEGPGMNDLLLSATAELARFLQRVLQPLAPDWWRSRVVDRLTPQQQRTVREHGQKRWEQLDLAALLRVFDQNWRDLSAAHHLPYEGRNWLKEMQTVRNKWALGVSI
ncbi:MAG: Swt1 family HEPN domain-containing protein [Thermoleophilia bacterium]|nr:Swt1 family HEPN domain-containing protein [Thermoleophilia bacterium]